MRTDADEFAELFADNYSVVVRFVFLRVNDHMIAEELAAEAFTIAWAKRGQAADRGCSPWRTTSSETSINGETVSEVVRAAQRWTNWCARRPGEPFGTMSNCAPR